MVSRRLSSGSTREAFRPAPIFILLVALTVAGGVMAWVGFGNPTINVLLLVIGGWLVSLSLHEYAHALVAYLNGDRSTAERGYLQLNLLKYTHPMLSIVFPVVFLLLGGIGLPGGAVWIDRHAIRSKLADSLISLAGPLVNLVFTVALVLPFAFGADSFTHHDFWAGLAFLAFLQLTASVLNLVPIPGVDGGNIIRPWLNAQWSKFFDTMAPWGMLVLFALLFQPEVRAIFFAVIDTICDLIGLPRYLADDGQRMFQFWR
jgi:Zn-dependent protease